MAPLVRTGGSRHTGLAAPPHRNIQLRKKLYALKNAGNITFVHGIGKRKTPLQKSIEALEEALSKLKEYTQKIHICGERNSYSKAHLET